ncbi:MAG: urease accessory UreF family protein [Ethanoligenens sp.]
MAITQSFMKLLQICDAFFPVGAFTLSNGLETYVQYDLVRKPTDLEAYLSAFLRFETYNDLALAAHAWAHADEREALLRLDALSAASKLPKEIREGARRMCMRFTKVARQMGVNCLEPYTSWIKNGEAFGQYAVAFGIYTRAQGVEQGDAVALLGYNFVSAAVNNCVKLVPLGQQDGQRILHQSLDAVFAAAETALTVEENDIGLALPGFDVRAMQHEHLYTRQYMS